MITFFRILLGHVFIENQIPEKQPLDANEGLISCFN